MSMTYNSELIRIFFLNTDAKAHIGGDYVRLKGKPAIVTGAGSGIGRATAISITSNLGDFEKTANHIFYLNNHEMERRICFDGFVENSVD